MSTNESLNEEIEATTSIYTTEILTNTSTPAESPATGTSAILRIPDVAYSFTLLFPPEYPDAPPQITGTHHVDADVKIGEGDAAVTALREILGEVYAPGSVCIFDLVEEAGPILRAFHEEHGQGQEQRNGKTENPQRPPGYATGDDGERTRLDNDTTTSATLPPDQRDPADMSLSSSVHAPPPNWIISETLTVNKSNFVARCVPIITLADATSSISHLLSTNKKVASATHNITAWRIKSPSPASNNNSKTKGSDSAPPEIIIQDSDDDGETAAGGRLLHLMQLMDVWNVVVVVSRWYGGVKLGPDRFRCVNAVAREVLVKAGFGKDEGGKGGGGKKGRK